MALSVLELAGGQKTLGAVDRVTRLKEQLAFSVLRGVRLGSQRTNMLVLDLVFTKPSYHGPHAIGEIGPAAAKYVRVSAIHVVP
jgi:hypothetical protein